MWEHNLDTCSRENVLLFNISYAKPYKAIQDQFITEMTWNTLKLSYREKFYYAGEGLFCVSQKFWIELMLLFEDT